MHPVVKIPSKLRCCDLWRPGHRCATSVRALNAGIRRWPMWPWSWRQTWTIHEPYQVMNGLDWMVYRCYIVENYLQRFFGGTGILGRVHVDFQQGCLMFCSSRLLVSHHKYWGQTVEEVSSSNTQECVAMVYVSIDILTCVNAVFMKQYT